MNERGRTGGNHQSKNPNESQSILQTWIPEEKENEEEVGEEVEEEVVNQGGGHCVNSTPNQHATN